MPGERLVLPVVLGLLAAPLLCSVLGHAFPAREVSPFLEKAAREGCVEEPAWMRVHHMELLRDLRDETVRSGERGDRSLAACQECHPRRDRFCDRCHAAVGLDPGCFDCHAWGGGEGP